MFDIDVKNSSEEKVLKFFSQQTELESVKCRIIFSCSSEFINTFLLCLLENCPKLRYVQLSCCNIILIKNDSFKKLIESKLDTLYFSFHEIVLDPNISINDISPLNRSLRKLHIDFQMSEKVQLTFLNTFCNLQFLELYHVTDVVLQSIWKNQVNYSSNK